MNKKMLHKNLGQFRRLWPLPFRYDPFELEYLQQMDDFWHCEGISYEEEKLTLTNIHTGHAYNLHFDNLIEFKNPDRFILKSQLTLSGIHIFESPLFRPPDLPFGPLRHR